MRYDESAHDAALRQHEERYDDMKRMAREFGRDSDQYRQAREDVVIARREVKTLSRRRKRQFSAT